MQYFRILLFLLTGPILMAQDGTRVFEFLNITTSPRQAALGGNAQSMWDSDPNMSLWNPALMNSKTHNQLAINYVGYLADIQFGTMSYVYQWDKKNFFSIHGQYVDYGDFLQTDKIGNITGDFTAKDAAIILGYARNINDFFTVGINAKYIHSQIESYTSYGAAVDVGVVFHDIDYDTNITLVARNIGAQIQPYNNETEPLPLQINLGVAHKLEHVPLELSATLHNLQKFDISQQEQDNGRETSNLRKAIDHVSVGAELFPDKGFNLRLGYNFKRGNELGSDLTKNFSGLTAGFGLKISAFKFEYAHARYNSSANVNHIGIAVDLERFVGRRHY